MKVPALVRAAALALSFLPSPATPAASPLVVSVTAHGQHPPQIAVVEADAGSKGQLVTTAKADLVNGQGEISLVFEQPGPWRIRASAPGLWGPEISVRCSFG